MRGEPFGDVARDDRCDASSSSGHQAGHGQIGSGVFPGREFQTQITSGQRYASSGCAEQQVNAKKDNILRRARERATENKANGTREIGWHATRRTALFDRRSGTLPHKNNVNALASWLATHKPVTVESPYPSCCIKKTVRNGIARLLATFQLASSRRSVRNDLPRNGSFKDSKGLRRGRLRHCRLRALRQIGDAHKASNPGEHER